MAEHIAIIGAGTMGSAFSRRLLAAGMRVSVWDPTPAATALRDAGVVLTMVPTIAAIEQTMPSVLSSLPPNAVWLQMSTIGVAGTERAQALAKEHRPDIVFVDAPVSGSRAPAEQGKLLILASGRRLLSTRCSRCFPRSVKRRCDGSARETARG
jgi:3-hydroxyisobutyrate dehydrogenase